MLIGEASHGTHEFHTVRAELSRLLIESKGFEAVAVEADWPDAYRVNYYVRGTERISHYFDARLSDQFDAVIHLDVTHGVQPLDRARRGNPRGRDVPFGLVTPTRHVGIRRSRPRVYVRAQADEHEASGGM